MRRLRLLGVLLLVSCSGSEPAEFPIGFFGVRDAADITFLSKEGFNAFQTYLTAPADAAALVKASRRAGALFMLNPGELIPAGPRPSGHADTWWYLQDEPDVHGLDAAAMKAIEAKTLTWAPGGKTAFVVGDGSKAKDYPGIADAIMVDWYPVPHRTLESAGDHVRMTAATAGGRKVWAVLQAMDWSFFVPPVIKGKRFVGRFPDVSEIRFMSYDAVLGGAQGIWYFIYEHPVGNKINKTPHHFQAVSSVARELRALAPVFAHGRPVKLPFDAPSDDWAARAWTYRGRDYLIIANRRKDRFRKVPVSALERGWRPLFEVRRDPRELLLAHNGFHYLKPYQVLVLESRIKPKRLLGL